MAETATEGCKDGEIINCSNLTFKNLSGIAVDGAITSFLISLQSSSWGKELISNSKVMKNLFAPEKGSACANPLVKMFGTKPLKAGLNSLATATLTPDITFKDAAIRTLSPTYNLYKTVEGFLF